MNVDIVDDEVLEMTEFFYNNLTRTLGLDPRISLAPVVAVVEILDNDGRYSIVATEYFYQF